MKSLKDFFNTLTDADLFRGITPDVLGPLLDCIDARLRNVRKGKFILAAGDKPDFIGIVLSGQLHIIRDDYDGNRSIIASVTQGQIFAEALSCAGVSESPVTVFAAADSTVMLMTFSGIIQSCPNCCSYHRDLIGNLLRLIANKNLILQNRMEIIELKSVREKVLLYLESFPQKKGRSITIPFNREEMADFLNVERSALSHELAKMKKDGLIEYQKNSFILK